jgi:hypothetical protein
MNVSRRFRSHARWTPADFRREISATIQRVNDSWVISIPISDDLFRRLQAIEQRITLEREQNNMHGVRKLLAEYEAITDAEIKATSEATTT